MATVFPMDLVEIGCEHCAGRLDFEFTFAFQPIVNIQEKKLFGYEALVRGPQGEGAMSILSRVNDDNRYMFDQACRVKAIGLAAQLKLKEMLSINFLPNAVYQPEHCIQSTLKAAKQAQFPIEQIMFEITESENVANPKHLTKIFDYYQKQGFVTAIDDFGAGHAGLNLLASFIPNILKIDMELVRDIDTNPVKQIIARCLVSMCLQLNITVLAEGIETFEEAKFYADLGVHLMQGYYFAKPGFECLPEVDSKLYNSL